METYSAVKVFYLDYWIIKVLSVKLKYLLYTSTVLQNDVKHFCKYIFNTNNDINYTYIVKLKRKTVDAFSRLWYGCSHKREKNKNLAS